MGGFFFLLFSSFLGLFFLGSSLGSIFLILALFFLGSQGPELESVNAALEGHFVPEEGIDHSVAGWLHLGFEGFRRDDESRNLALAVVPWWVRQKSARSLGT